MRFSLVNEGSNGKNVNSQTWPGTPRRPSPRHPRPPEFFSQAYACLSHRMLCCSLVDLVALIVCGLFLPVKKGTVHGKTKQGEQHGKTKK